MVSGIEAVIHRSCIAIPFLPDVAWHDYYIFQCGRSDITLLIVIHVALPLLCAQYFGLGGTA